MGITFIINYVANPTTGKAFRLMPSKNGNQLQNVENRIFLQIEGLHLTKKKEKDLKVRSKFHLNCQDVQKSFSRG